MSTLKVAAVITVTSGVLAAGITSILPKRASEPEPHPVATSGFAPRALTPVPAPAAVAPLREPDRPVAVAPVPPQAPSAPPAPVEPPTVVAALPPPKAEVPAEIQRPPVEPPVAPRDRITGPIEPEPGPWQSTPQPELREKAETMLDKGDVTSARLWLKLASDKGDADAMFRLAETYDPDMLGEWHVVGMTSDAALARKLYAKALLGGVEAARPKLARRAP